MALETIISITGKPGLYKILSQIKNGLIVESLVDKKRLPVYASEKVSALNDISIYTYTSDVPLKEVYEKLFEKTGGKEAINHKAKPEELRAYLKEVIEDFDEERVYHSDLKKLFQWFNLLVSNGILIDAKKEETVAKKATAKKPAAKKAPAKKPVAKKSAPKTSGAKGGGKTATPSKKGK
ncbi:MAG: DUF5606 domain-containing protein [Vicingaceae bacterium]|nr:DUF5606 domain-containing protein [Vicingaceae bacterium]